MTDSEDDGSVTVKIDLYPEDGEIKALRQIGLGLQPFMLLEAVADGEDVAFQFTGSLIDTPEDLVEMLEGFLDALKAGLEQHAEAQALAPPAEDDLLEQHTEAEADRG